MKKERNQLRARQKVLVLGLSLKTFLQSTCCLLHPLLLVL